MALRTSEPVTRQMEFATGDGARIPVLVHAGPVRSADGAVEGAVAVVQNVTELVRLQEAVARSQRLQGLGTLAAGVAHDFNNALAMILGHAELATEGAADAEVRKRLGFIIQVASDAAGIVWRIQDLARTRASRDEVPTAIGDLLREVAAISEPRWRGEAQAAGREYDVGVTAATGLQVLGAPAELREAILNLVLNALDAMPGGGRLVLAVARVDEQAVVRISDNGVGMPPEVRERIFEPYFTTKGEHGNGLGLAVVFSILQRHGAEVCVESEPGSGTTFVLAFPLIDAGAPSVEPAAAPAPPQRRRILVVDDEPSLGDLTAMMLRLQGHEVHVARGGRAALDIMGNAEVDIVLTDLGMPGMTGWELAAEVRRMRPEIRIILMTGWGNALSDEQAREGGVDAVISKPFSRDALVKAVGPTPG